MDIKRIILKKWSSLSYRPRAKLDVPLYWESGRLLGAPHDGYFFTHFEAPSPGVVLLHDSPPYPSNCSFLCTQDHVQNKRGTGADGRDPKYLPATLRRVLFLGQKSEISFIENSPPGSPRAPWLPGWPSRPFGPFGPGAPLGPEIPGGPGGPAT